MLVAVLPARRNGSDPAQATKSGLGIYGIRCGSIVTVAIVAVNALGTVCLPDGTPLAGHT